GSVDRYCRDRFVALFERLKSEGKIAPRVDIPTLAEVFNTIGDGLFWRRAVHPGFDAAQVLPALTGLLRDLMNPITPPAGGQTQNALEPVQTTIVTPSEQRS